MTWNNNDATAAKKNGICLFFCLARSYACYCRITFNDAKATGHRVASHLELEGLLTRDDGNGHLTLDLRGDDAMNELQGRSITYRIAVGPQQGRKVFALQTIPYREEDDFESSQVGKIADFSLHAGVATKTREREKLECLCRYIARPAVIEKRLALNSHRKVSPRRGRVLI
jgi:hypothetical protein